MVTDSRSQTRGFQNPKCNQERKGKRGNAGQNLASMDGGEASATWWDRGCTEIKFLVKKKKKTFLVQLPLGEARSIPTAKSVVSVLCLNPEL